jgi:hypothetical protein
MCPVSVWKFGVELPVPRRTITNVGHLGLEFLVRRRPVTTNDFRGHWRFWCIEGFWVNHRVLVLMGSPNRDPKGALHWRFRYRFAGKRKTLALGTYPVVTLDWARSRHKSFRDLLANGIDPSALKPPSESTASA